MGLLSWLRGGRGAERPAGPPTAPPPPASREDRFDVTALPPIQRVLSAPSLVTDPSAFERGLPTRQPTALSTPLGHLVSAEAPSGLVEGVTTPVQRSVVEFPVRSSGLSSSVASPGGSTPGDLLPSGGVRGPGTAAPGWGAPLEPVQRTAGGPLPIPAPHPSAPGAGRTGEAVRVQRSSEPSRAEETPGSPEAVETGAVGPGSVDDGAAPEAAGEPGPPAPADAVDAVAQPSVRPLVGEQPLLDLPEPDAAGPGGVGEAAGEAAVGGVPPVQRSLTPHPSPSPSPSPANSPSPTPASPRAPGLGAPLPALPATAQREVSGAAPSPSPAPVRTESTPLPPPAPARAPEVAHEPVAPLLADRPLVLRTVAPDTSPDATSPALGPSPEPAVVPVRWENHRETSAGPFGPSGPAVQRRTHVPTAVTPVQRATARPSGLPAPAVPRAPRDAGDVAVAAGIAQRMADGSVVFAPPPAYRPSPSPASPLSSLSLPSPPSPPSPPSAFVQREVAAEEPPPPAPDDPPANAPDPLPEPGTGVEAGTAGTADGPAPPPGAPPGAPPVTDEFVRALYPSLARLLKAELRLERERAGRLIDTRF
ncbi:hypothetical protein [Streptomyces hydrogenans]|uniref:hypothetical protein n=1 Tax=Streptomyces hydrogenans TaxID=1873719 RepID=UPI0035E3B4D7